VSIFVSLLGLAFLILIHEAGHFFVARGVGMNPRKFYLGFPPAVVKTKRNGIEYGVGAIPLGGYVKIPGMHRPAPGDLDVHFGTGALALDLEPGRGLTDAIENPSRIDGLFIERAMILAKGAPLGSTHLDFGRRAHSAADHGKRGQRQQPHRPSNSGH